MENLLINHNGQLVQAAPILQEMDCVFAVDLLTKENIWIDTKTGEIKEDSLELIGID